MKDWKYSHIANILKLDQIPPCFNIPVVSHCIENKILAPYQRATSSSISGPLFPSNFTSNITSLSYWQHSSLPFTHQASFCLRTFAHPFPRSSQGHFLLQHPSLASSAHSSPFCPHSPTSHPIYSFLVHVTHHKVIVYWTGSYKYALVGGGCLGSKHSPTLSLSPPRHKMQELRSCLSAIHQCVLGAGST